MVLVLLDLSDIQLNQLGSSEAAADQQTERGRIPLPSECLSPNRLEQLVSLVRRQPSEPQTT